MASEGANGRLIEALEEGRLESVLKALREGADPTKAAKTVTLVCKLGLFSDRLQDTRLMESALCIAIRSGKSEIVWSLLQSGCDPNTPIQWKIATAVHSWTRATWDESRWWLSPTFPSALDFALASGGRAFNKRGAYVVLTNPSFSGQIYDWVDQTPDPDVIKVLLEHGADVSESCLDTASKLGNPQILAIMADHMRRAKDKDSFQTASSSSVKATTPSPPPSQLERSTAPSPTLSNHSRDHQNAIPSITNIFRSQQPQPPSYAASVHPTGSITSLGSVSTATSAVGPSHSPKMSLTMLSTGSFSSHPGSLPTSPQDSITLLSPGSAVTVGGSGTLAVTSGSGYPGGLIGLPLSRSSSINSMSNSSTHHVAVDHASIIGQMSQQLAEQVRVIEDQRQANTKLMQENREFRDFINKLTQENRELKEVVFKLMKEHERRQSSSKSSDSNARLLFPDSSPNERDRDRDRDRDRGRATFSDDSIGSVRDKPPSGGILTSPNTSMRQGKRNSSRVRIQLPSDDGPEQIAELVENAFRHGGEDGTVSPGED
ncbi:hypothetical protein M427DRAFT_131355 [Gonapodya prolifera JEL478]|uniref:Ankyrin n=1 Tax=Gonapodya prolifera (strain JEL478) TaxID=1344416 RepID=A0A139AV17_GONPJ|nr:hypothetical protein M427DRAFT_131355 [Gonapodya prolifera JEL478]|eukprot:KXS20580.1 hypothetical protein M427DRAFT_131355 [Gonapodya prolifera JEL478]